MPMTEEEILAYQREKIAQVEAGPYSWAARLAAAQAGSPFVWFEETGSWMPESLLPPGTEPYVPPPGPEHITMTPEGITEITYKPLTPAEAARYPELLAEGAPAPVTPAIFTNGGKSMPNYLVVNGYGSIVPGSPPPTATYTVAANGRGYEPAGTSDISIGGLIALLGGAGTLVLGYIRALIAKVGWSTIVTVLGTALAAKVLAMLNDGSPDSSVIDTGGGGDAGRVVKRWRAGTQAFWMTQDGRIHTRTKNGILKSWRPAKPIVMVRGKTTLGQAVKAQRYLDKLWRTVAKRTKALKLA